MEKLLKGDIRYILRKHLTSADLWKLTKAVSDENTVKKLKFLIERNCLEEVVKRLKNIFKKIFPNSFNF